MASRTAKHTLELKSAEMNSQPPRPPGPPPVLVTQAAVAPASAPVSQQLFMPQTQAGYISIPQGARLPPPSSSPPSQAIAPAPAPAASPLVYNSSLRHPVFFTQRFRRTPFETQAQSAQPAPQSLGNAAVAHGYIFQDATTRRRDGGPGGGSRL
ncbi:hypothetical protein MKZ38_003591 [Zalerion maritima]|uniref:Uncharacterized protein n=1 Tax=Zalerion maritima TaxID=339359 RepID=A0AAD5WRN1_9PEZI|nr:hypothetical protein MKZ38_003591 [Zalerion maritima]